MGSCGNTVSPLEGLSRGYALGVCFGVYFGGMLLGLLRMDGTYFISKRLPANVPTFYVSLCISLHPYIYIYIEREREREGKTRMVFWCKTTAKGQNLVFPSTCEAPGYF